MKRTYKEANMIIAAGGQDASKEVQISWHMDLTKKHGKVIYTTKSDELWENAKTISGTKQKVKIFQQRVFWHYQVTLKNLQPNTEYMYKVGQETFSEVRFFKTAGKKSFKFVAVGDFHIYTPIPKREKNITNIIKTAINLEKEIDFLISVGDDVAYGTEYDYWGDLLENFQYKEYLWATALGNHDVYNTKGKYASQKYFLKTHNYPKNGYYNQKGLTYFFKYSDVLFIFFNNEDLTTNKQLLKAQKWARKVIKKHPTKFIIVVMHYHFFSGVTGKNYRYESFYKFFDEQNVDLAIAGHNHIYLRSKKLYNNQESEKGTVYLQVPSADGDRGMVMKELEFNEDKIAYRWTEGTDTVGATIVAINNSQIEIKLINRWGQVIDNLIIEKKL